MDITLGSGTPAHLAIAEGARRGLVVIPDIWGLRPLFSQMCDELSEKTGWSVGAFDPFGGAALAPAEDPAGFTERVEALKVAHDDVVLGDAAAAADALEVGPVGLIGFCMGGMYALKASAMDRFDRIAAFYGMITVPEDWSGPGQGQPLDALGLRGDTAVMAVVGTADTWTPADQVDRLRAAGVDVVSYEGADHGFVHDPSRPSHRADDAADAWERALAFLAG